MPEQHRPRFETEAQRTTATRAQMDEHIAYEIARLMEEHHLSQAEIAAHAGYKTGSQISKILSGTAVLPVQYAINLDAADLTGMNNNAGKAKTTVGLTFEQLTRERDAKRKTSVASPTRAQYDIFLAAPMASVDSDQYDRDLTLVEDFIAALEKHSLSVYSAMRSIPTADAFDTSRVAFTTNWEAIQLCERFVAFIPSPSPTAPPPGADVRSPSSVWVEAGMALARAMPCTFFVPSTRELPYIVRQAHQDKGKLGTIKLDVFVDKNSRAGINAVRRNGLQALA